MAKLPAPKKTYSKEEQDNLIKQLHYNLNHSLSYASLLKEHAQTIQILVIELNLIAKNRIHDTFGKFIDLYDKIFKNGEFELRKSTDQFDKHLNKMLAISSHIDLLQILEPEEIEKITINTANAVKRALKSRTKTT